MTDYTVSPGQPIRATHVNQFSRWLTGVTKSHTTAITNTHATEYALTLTNEQTSAGNALKLVSGSSTVALFNKTGSMMSKVIVGDPATGATTNYFTYVASGDSFEGVEWYRAGTRQALFATRGIIMGPVNAWASGSTRETGVPYAVFETVPIVDGNNGPKAFVPSLGMQEIGPDPCEINMYLQAATAGATFAAHTEAGAHIGMLVWWAHNGLTSGNMWNKTAQLSSKTAQIQNTTQRGGSLSLLTTPLSGGTGSSPIPRLTVSPSGWSIIDDSMPSPDASYWNVGYITGVASLLELRGATTPTLTIKSYTAAAANQTGDIAVVFGAASGAISNTNGGLWIRTIVERTSPTFRSQVDFLSNIGNSLVEVLRFDAAGTTTAIRGLSVATGGATITGNSTVVGTLTASTRVTASNGLTVSTGGATISGTSTITGALTVSTLVTAQAGLAVTTGPVTFPAASITSAAISLTDTTTPTAQLLTARSIAKGWATFSYDGATVVVGNSYNVANISRITTGHYGITWATAFSSIEYVLAGSVLSSNNRFKQHVLTQTTGTASIQTTGSANDTVGDPTGTWRIYVVGFGMQ